MNWDRIEGNWKQFKGNAKQQWGKLTDDQLDVIAGKRESLVGKIQETYGLTKDETEKQVAAWEEQFLRFMREQRPEVRNTLVESRKLTADLEAKLGEAIVAFQAQYKKPGK